MSIGTKFANAQNYFPPATFAPGTVVVCRGERAVVRNTVRRLGATQGGEWTVIRRERDGRILNCRPQNLRTAQD
jgi:hypothetical protein